MPTEYVEPSAAASRDGLATQNIDITQSDFMERVREATASPSPLAELLQDPDIRQSLYKSKHKHRDTSSAVSREPRLSKSMLGLVLAEEENRAYRLKSVIWETAERLGGEVRRANEAEARAEAAESKARDTLARALSAEDAAKRAEIESSRYREEIGRYQTRLNGLERDLRRVLCDLARAERGKEDAEDAATTAKDNARMFQVALREFQAREEGREEARQLLMEKWYNKGEESGFEAGRLEGFEDGKYEGYKEGRRAGLEDGLKEGRQQGRSEERQNALQAFDKFLETEMDGNSFDKHERIRAWAESIYPSVQERPAPPPRRPTV